jgi:hypothetical protein
LSLLVLHPEKIKEIANSLIKSRWVSQKCANIKAQWRLNDLFDPSKSWANLDPLLSPSSEDAATNTTAD